LRVPLEGRGGEEERKRNIQLLDQFQSHRALLSILPSLLRKKRDEGGRTLRRLDPHRGGRGEGKGIKVVLTRLHGGGRLALRPVFSSKKEAGAQNVYALDLAHHTPPKGKKREGGEGAAQTCPTAAA